MADQVADLKQKKTQIVDEYNNKRLVAIPKNTYLVTIHHGQAEGVANIPQDC